MVYYTTVFYSSSLVSGTSPPINTRPYYSLWSENVEMKQSDQLCACFLGLPACANSCLRDVLMHDVVMPTGSDTNGGFMASLWSITKMLWLNVGKQEMYYCSIAEEKKKVENE